MRVPWPYVAQQQRGNFDGVVQYYFPGQEQFILPESASFSSDILAEEDHKLLLQGWIEESQPGLDAEVTLSLLYQGSRDGFGAADFHAKCDDKGATVTIVKSTEGFIFGGYSDQSWATSGDSYGVWKSSSRAFLFSVVNSAKLAPLKLPQDQQCDEEAVYCEHDCGPSFGSEDDLNIDDECNSDDSSYSYLGGTYTLPPGQNAQTFLAGSNNFRVADYEVFAALLCSSDD